MENKIRVLIADSDDDLRYLMAETIAGEENMSVVGCSGDGREILQMASQLHPDVVVMDLILKKSDGMNILQKLLEAEPNLPVIIVTSLCNDQLVRRAASLGACCFMEKPCDIPALLSRIRLEAMSPIEKISIVPNIFLSNIESDVTDVLLEFSIPARISGFHFLRKGIIMSLKDTTCINLITKVIYPEIAKEYNTTSGRVERAMRNAIEIAWKKSDDKTIRKYFGRSASKNNKRPSNGEFMAIITDYLTLKRKAL